MGMNGADTIRGETQSCRAAESGRGRMLDLWLRESLACAYDDVLCEDLPASWLAMISGGKQSD